MEKAEFWAKKVERKEKPKRRPEGMTKAEWEEDKKKRREASTKVGKKLEELREKNS